MKKYRIISRYEYISPSGISWTHWFQEFFMPISDTEDELMPMLKSCKDKAKSIEKSTKRKIEFKIEEFDYKPISIEELINVPTTKKRVKKKS